MTTWNFINKPASSPLSCSMTSGKSGLWCDASLSCLRISTPQKPWSPTAELKTCWPPTTDSRSRHLPALGSTAPSTLDSHGHPLRPGARVTLATRVGLHPSSHHKFTQNPQFSFIPAAPVQKPCVRLPQISAFSGFFLYLETSGSVFVCLLALATFSVFSSYFPHQFLLPSFLFPHPCALTVNVEPGSTDATTLVPSFLLANVFTMDRTWKHRNWLTRSLRIVSWSLLGFLFCQREQKQNPLVRWKTRLSRHLLCVFFTFFAQSNGHLVSAKTVVFFMFVCLYLWLLTETPAFLFHRCLKDFFCLVSV